MKMFESTTPWRKEIVAIFIRFYLHLFPNRISKLPLEIRENYVFKIFTVAKTSLNFWNTSFNHINIELTV